VARNELGMVKKGDLLYRHMESPAKKEEAVPPPASGMDRLTPDDTAPDKSQESADNPPPRRNPT
jgi:hypothetical protein